ncbi:MAG: hypothetical protein J7M26_03350, partial [Armatimonadetes bacterium]|nr:hypothetical protein [Armatimonadota bacterium]
MEPLALGSQRQILFDRYLVAEAKGFELRTIEGIKDGPVLTQQAPWEANGIWAWVSVLYENGVVRLWYDAIGEDGVWRVAYAVSTDGVHFVRPNLGLYEYKGSRANNICFVGPKGYHAGSVFYDPAAPADERYKLVYGGGGAIGDTPYLHIALAVSPDGLHWHHASDQIIPWYTDTMNVAFYDPATQTYKLYVRYWTGKLRYEKDQLVGREDYGRRGVGFAESKDLRTFAAPELVLAPDDEDPADMDLYNSAARKYPLADCAYLIFTSAFHHHADALDVQIATSRDGRHWERPDRRPAITLGPVGAFDSEQIYVAAGEADVGDEIWLYYGGYDVGHNVARPGKCSAAIGRVRWLRDRFV